MSLIKASLSSNDRRQCIKSYSSISIFRLSLLILYCSPLSMASLLSLLWCCIRFKGKTKSASKVWSSGSLKISTTENSQPTYTIIHKFTVRGQKNITLRGWIYLNLFYLCKVYIKQTPLLLISEHLDNSLAQIVCFKSKRPTNLHLTVVHKSHMHCS